MIRDEVLQLLKNMNELFRSGWSVTYIQHQMGKDSMWFKDNMKKAEFQIYEEMKSHYAFWRKRTPIDKKMPCYFDSVKESMH